MKKLLFVAAANSIHTIKWVNSLTNDFEVHLVYCKNHFSKINFVNKNVFLYKLPFRAPYGYYLNCIKLRKLFKRINPDIVNVHYASGYGTLARLSKLRPELLSIWGSDVYDFPNQSKFKKKILWKNLKYANAIASTSNIMVKRLKELFPNLREKVYITPFGVDVDKFSPNKNSKNTLDFKIGVVKTLKEKYGIKYAILAVKYLKDKLISNHEEELANSIKFYIYGDGEQKNELQELINNNNLQQYVFLMGKIPNNKVPEVLNTFDVFCATSNNESFGVSVVEAMSCALPVVATNADGFCEIVDDNVTGYLVKKQNIVEIANRLENILKNKDLALNFGKKGRESVLKNYDWCDNVKTMVSVYYEIIANEENKNDKD